MSKIGKKAINVPSGVTVAIDKNVISFKGAKFEEKLDTKGRVSVKLEDSSLIFDKNEKVDNYRAYWGLYRSLASNIIVGLTQGFSKQLDLVGVGYKAVVKGKDIELSLGYSHPILLNIPSELDVKVEKNSIIISGHDKQKVGQFAAVIRSKREPEPYKGKGVKYSDERIIRKAGKSASK